MPFRCGAVLSLAPPHVPRLPPLVLRQQSFPQRKKWPFSVPRGTRAPALPSDDLRGGGKGPRVGIAADLEVVPPSPPTC